MSYAAPGLNSPSIAAITVSINANATRYAAAIKTNSYYEVAAMKKAFAKINIMPRFLVIIASKRYYVRFFP
ncbi:unnamed protein product [Aureobasidium pullulans]|nr:unnamed protein product [Aureobasidium pullulans]